MINPTPSGPRCCGDCGLFRSAASHPLCIMHRCLPRDPLAAVCHNFRPYLPPKPQEAPAHLDQPPT
jgi:hypothetical protein